jgi:hypothetical protein
VADYAWSCLQCPAHGTGSKFDLDARKHEAATKHATSTHLADGPFERGGTA